MALITCMMLLTAGQVPASNSLLIGPSPEAMTGPSPEAITGPSPEALQKDIEALNQKLREYERRVRELQAEVQNVARAGWERERALLEQQKKLQRTLDLTERAWREERAPAAGRAPVSSGPSRVTQKHVTYGVPTYREGSTITTPVPDQFTVTPSGVTYYTTTPHTYVAPRQYVLPPPR